MALWRGASALDLEGRGDGSLPSHSHRRTQWRRRTGHLCPGNKRFDNVAAVIAVSPGEYDHEGVTALHGESISFASLSDREGQPPSGQGVNVERTGLRRLLQSGQSLQCDHSRGEHGLAICFRCSGERRWWATGDPGGGRETCVDGTWN